MSAYISPAVDISDERFFLAVPDLESVMVLAMDRFGWDNCQVDKLLKSVIWALEEKNINSHRVKLPNKWMMVSTEKKLEETIRKVSGLKSDCIEISDCESF